MDTVDLQEFTGASGNGCARGDYIVNEQHMTTVQDVSIAQTEDILDILLTVPA